MTEIRLLSIQVGQPATHGADSISEKSWTSGIFKAPVSGQVWLDTLNLAGDGQEDLKNHGGPFRAVLGYAANHYPIWRAELDRPELPYGSFGENFTIDGLDENSVCIGDVYAVGEARLQVAQPRYPCWKLARRNNISDLAARVEARGWGGWYHKVLQTGYVEAGQTITLLERPHPEYTIAMLNDFISERADEPETYSKLADLEVLSTDWRKIFARKAAQV